MAFLRSIARHRVALSLLCATGVAQPLVFGITGGWAKWKTMTARINLAPGWENSLRFESTGQSLGNIDQVTVQ